MQQFNDTGAGDIVLAMADRIVANKAYLSEIDGKIGDGDHGVNMAKGFGMAADRLRGGTPSLSDAFDALGTVLMGEIGGSMGPLYSVMFTGFAEALKGADAIDAPAFARMLHAWLDEVQGIGGAKMGDKTLLDALVPAIAAFDAAVASGRSFADALAAMTAAAEAGRDSTVDLVAKLGRVEPGLFPAPVRADRRRMSEAVLRRGRTASTSAPPSPDMPLRFGDDPFVWACWLYYEDRLTQGDIADVMGISRGTVNS